MAHGRMAVSVNPEDEAGYRIWCSIPVSRRAEIKVYLNATLQPLTRILAADEFTGEIVRQLETPDGRLLFDPARRAILTETLRGQVVVLLPPGVIV